MRLILRLKTNPHYYYSDKTRTGLTLSSKQATNCNIDGLNKRYSDLLDLFDMEISQPPNMRLPKELVGQMSQPKTDSIQGLGTLLSEIDKQMSSDRLDDWGDIW